MVYYADLSRYSYLTDDEDRVIEVVDIPDGCIHFVPGSPRLNVGWLGDSCRPGPVDAALVAALREIAAHQRINVTRGYHHCEIGVCPDLLSLENFYSGTEETRGDREIRVPGEHGVVFAAPALIAHYVEAHGYRPPAAFAAATKAFVAHGGHIGEPSWVPPDADRDY
ncbi:MULTISPECIES: hypothetical protein [unclassified Kitasatospora]|uniref:DUF7919 family protein n=1 Tax=unclassified Kitasatospora TaxID=2633591 RepID=UPI00070BD738|nr:MULTISPECIES: hypothetical protein [unclassified Kitasatospora]KQV11917.1 hypothetical protein ASC99_35670 [Kitasatospora sp. Root107]KRB68884.1 hypothetical protein ASE03_28710 [Kitasatospora sp. Root187]